MAKHVLLEKYKELKEIYGSPEASFMWWEKNAARPELGVYNIDSHSRKLSLRAYDDTPSTAVYDRLTYVDFGGDGTAKDPVARIMEVTQCKFNEALKMILEWEGDCPEAFIPVNTGSYSKNQEEQRSAYSNNYIRDMILNKAKYKEEYNALVPGLFRSCSEKEISNGERLFSIGFSPKSQYEMENRIFIPEFDSQKIAWGSYKYNRGSDKKGLLRKNSKRVIFGSHLLSKFKENIILSEGHTDVIVNVSKGLSCLTTGSSTKKFNENVELLAGKHLHDFPDLDIAGMLGALNRGLEIQAWNIANPGKEIKHTVYWWAEWFYDKKLAEKILNNGVAKSELFYNLVQVNGIPIKKEHAHFNIEILALLQEEYAQKKKIEIPDYLRIHSWKIVSRGSKKAGYDWIDFHTENSNKEGYQKFLQTFKY